MYNKGLLKMKSQPVLEFQLSDDISMEELKFVYSLIKYIPWNEKEILEIKRVHTILRSRHNRNYYDPQSFHRDVTKLQNKFYHPRRLHPPIPKKKNHVKKI